MLLLCLLLLLHLHPLHLHLHLHLRLHLPQYLLHLLHLSHMLLMLGLCTPTIYSLHSPHRGAGVYQIYVSPVERTWIATTGVLQAMTEEACMHVITEIWSNSGADVAGLPGYRSFSCSRLSQSSQGHPSRESSVVCSGIFLSGVYLCSCPDLGFMTASRGENP